MAYILKAEGANSFNIGVESVQKLHYSNKSANSTSARARDSYQTVVAYGRIRSTVGNSVKDETIDLAKWSTVKAESRTAYQKVTATALANSLITRQIEMPEAFVVGYEESFDSKSGTGTFAVTLRQKKDNQRKVQISGGFESE